MHIPKLIGPHLFCLRGWLTALLLVAGACGAEEDRPGLDALPAPEPVVAVASAPILNGSTPDNQTIQKGGFVALSDRRADGTTRVFCSGALFTNWHLITARHCFEAESTVYLQSSPTSMRILHGSESRTAKSIWFARSTIDYAIVEVASSFNMPRNSDDMVAPTGFTRQFSTVPNNTPVICFGHGRVQETCGSNPNDCTGPGVGTLRWATLTATTFPFQGRTMYRFFPNSQNQLQARGDSGGVCVAPTRSFAQIWKQPIITVASQCFPGDFCNAEAAASAMFDSWVKISP